MTEPELSSLLEKVRHNVAQEYHWRAERYFWMGTVIVSVVALIVTAIYFK